ncbi:uncharacterized protein [Primulina eburnea]|uniref:uncharacterized protein n=1 Tax=Primulina eburnea TaxID=1245227 RepID=UPI003C6C26D5
MGYYSSAFKLLRASFPAADAVSWYCAVVLLGLILLGGTSRETTYSAAATAGGGGMAGNLLRARPCDEIYVVGEGETLHTISDKCSDPFIVERNPHIHDPDDVFPGLVIKITPFPTKS